MPAVIHIFTRKYDCVFQSSSFSIYHSNHSNIYQSLHKAYKNLDVKYRIETVPIEASFTPLILAHQRTHFYHKSNEGINIENLEKTPTT
jgi:hypothetical protein